MLMSEQWLEMHRRRKVSNIGGPRLRIMGRGGGTFRWLETNRGQHPPSQIITVLILKSDIIAKSRIKLKGIFLPIPSNKINCIYINILRFSSVHLLSAFHCFT